MHRLTARIMLVVALLGAFAPSALAALYEPPHACCVRRVHHCHNSIDPDSELAIRDVSCCKNEGCRAVTTTRWAHAQPPSAGFFLRAADLSLAAQRANIPFSAPAESQSTRAPPAS